MPGKKIKKYFVYVIIYTYHCYTKLKTQIMRKEKTVFDTLQELMEKFDFEGVHAYMVLTNWKWSLPEQEPAVPSVETLKLHANMFLNKAAFDSKPGEAYCGGSGGFYAYRFTWGGTDFYKLAFEPFGKSSY
jgi:hypothetical protein